jgi:hypothetical protein
VSSEFLDAIAQRLIQADLAAEGELIACSGADIATIESAAGISLPTVYKDFLQTMGRKAGNFLEGSDFLYPDLLNLNNAANSILKELQLDYRLSKNDFVFWMHQGYQFTFFDASEGNDPSVLFFTDSYKKPERTTNSFSKWLTALAKRSRSEL